MAKTNRTPADTDRLKADLARLSAEDAGRRRDRLADPTDSSHFDFDPALTPDPELVDVPDFHKHADEVLTIAHAHPFDGPHEHADDDAPTIVLSAAASPRGGAMADPPAAPDVQQSSSEPSPTTSPAGSGGGSGRSPATAITKQTTGSARPLSLSGAPGSRLADVSSLSSTWTLLGIPVDLQDDLTWFQIAKHALDAMIEEVIRTRRPADAELLTAAYDAIGHVVVARGLLDLTDDGTGS